MSIKSSFRRTAAVSAFGLAVSVSGPALAAHTVVFSPEVYTFAVAGTGDASAAADIRNGVANPASNYVQGMATTETHSLTASGSTLTAEVTTTSLSVPGRTSSAATYSSLDTGIMRARIIQTIPTAFGFPGADTQTQFQDTFFFTNSSGHAVNLALTFSFDGSAKVFEPKSLNGLAYLLLSGCGSCSNTLGQGIQFAGTGKDASVAAYSVFNDAGVYSVYDQYSGQTLDKLGFSVQANTNGIGSIIRTTIAVPTGETSLGFKAYLNLSARGAASADFGHTAQFNVGPVADGLSYTSASGVFLTASPVPEPAAWALMLCGVALVGSATMRRGSTGVAAPT